MPDDQIDLSNGGTAVVVLSPDFAVAANLLHHKQVLPLTVDQLNGTAEDVAKQIPPGTRIAVMCGDQIPGLVYANVTNALRRRGVPYVTRKNPAAVEQTINSFHLQTSSTNGDTSDGDATAAAKPLKGALNAFIQEHANLRAASMADEARRLLPIAKQHGISTTFGSLSQGISVAKRKGNYGSRPASAMTKQQQAVKLLDDSIAGLSLLREYIQTTEAENIELKAKLDVVAALFKQNP